VESSLQSVLLKYWGFSAFRPLQEDIISSVLSGRDTLALLPTGGGKSICFQVPAMAMEGLCIVVTPLVALMKDQVQGLKNKDIKAVAIYYGLSKREIDVAIDNCVYGDYKFLYLSPERLTTDVIRSRIKKMNVSLLAVDEAHCISQWGYDFRPPYLRIAEIRELIPDTPILALTATATTQVVEDIQEKLSFANQQVFRKSFERKNLAYMVFHEENKMGKLLQICNKQQGTGIVYVRNRKKTREVAEYLQQAGIAADFYHAGLTTLERDLKQNAWMKERTRVIVSTNAFGMGIDKPNVRFVVHLDLPDSPEAYFQEAGRGGRDGNKSFAVLLVNQSDIIDLKRHHEQSFPSLSFIKQVYNSLGNFFQLAVGSGKDQSMEFDVTRFSTNYNMDPVLVFNALKFLEKEGYIGLSEALSNPSRIMFIQDKEELYRFQVANPAYDVVIKTILRSYTGLFTEFVKVNEPELSRRLDMGEKKLVKILDELHQKRIIQYEKQNQKPMVSWLEERLDASHLRISKENHKERKQFSAKRMQAMIDFVASDNTCRSIFLLSYFGEYQARRCGQCDVCLERNRLDVSEFEYEQLVKLIQDRLMDHPTDTEELLAQMPSNIQQDKSIRVIRWLKDNGRILESESGLLSWHTNTE
jgi:ATP-dependent DNA helicase RecQ